MKSKLLRGIRNDVYFIALLPLVLVALISVFFESIYLWFSSDKDFKTCWKEMTEGKNDGLN